MTPAPEDKPRSVEVQISARSSAFAEGDPRWHRQVAELLTQLNAGAVPIRKEGVGNAGEKGGAEAIILALGSAGAISASVTIFKAWLGRSADRSVKISGKVGDRNVDLEITAQNIDEKTLRQALSLAQGSK
jgi:hypothetical protein